MLNANTIIGARYKVVKPLGGGGMKLVYLAEDLRLASRRCALAEMVDSFTNPDMQHQAVEAFQREADMLAQLNNEHIPRVFDRFSEQNHHYLVMEYIDGITLEEALKAAAGKLDEARVGDIALQILDTLIYLHGLVPPVVYRDLKPSNVMLMGNGQVKLIDFGIARFFQPLRNATMIGTQGYAPPEQYRGKAETRSDLYALGATMHHALSGRDPTSEPPFSFPPLRKAAPAVSVGLADLVDLALAYDVTRRIPDAMEFKRRLMALRGGDSSGMAAASVGAAPVSAQDSRATPSPSAPTVLTDANAIDVRCPGCGMHVPADSKFCSYCAADLRRVLGPAEVVSEPAAETIILSDHRDQLAYPAGAGVEPSAGRERSLRGLRAMIAMGAVFVAVLIGARIFYQFNSYQAPPGDEEGSIVPPEEPAPAPEEPAPEAPAPAPEAPAPPSGPEAAEPPHRNPREQILRRVLDMQGYHSVHFRIVDGTTVELWGTVPTRFDRLEVQNLASAFTGLMSLEDHLKVERDDFPFAGPD